VGLSAPLMHRLADEAIALVLLDDNGRYKARLEGACSGNVLLRRAQHQRAMDSGFTLQTARAFVAGKVKNARQVLQRGAAVVQALVDLPQLALRGGRGVGIRHYGKPVVP
jgi:CRISPR-associated protein Cas1